MLAHRDNIDPEHAMLAEAARTWTATESIDRKLGEELIATARQVVGAWRAPPSARAHKRLHKAIDKLELLVGRP